jgi:hypothetical protein
MVKTGIAVVVVALGLLAGCQHGVVDSDVGTTESAIGGKATCYMAMPKQQVYYAGQTLPAVEAVVMFASPTVAGHVWAFGVNPSIGGIAYFLDLEKKMIGTFSNGVMVQTTQGLAVLGVVAQPLPPPGPPLQDQRFYGTYALDVGSRLVETQKSSSETAYQCGYY